LWQPKESVLIKGDSGTVVNTDWEASWGQGIDRVDKWHQNIVRYVKAVFYNIEG
jgi:hypothetical protein